MSNHDLDVLRLYLETLKLYFITIPVLFMFVYYLIQCALKIRSQNSMSLSKFNVTCTPCTTIAQFCFSCMHHVSKDVIE